MDRASGCTRHFTISSFGTLAAYARQLGMEQAATDFHKAGANENEIDQRLTALAEREINLKAKTPIAISNVSVRQIT